MLAFLGLCNEKMKKKYIKENKERIERYYIKENRKRLNQEYLEKNKNKLDEELNKQKEEYKNKLKELKEENKNKLKELKEKHREEVKVEMSEETKRKIFNDVYNKTLEDYKKYITFIKKYDLDDFDTLITLDPDNNVFYAFDKNTNVISIMKEFVRMFIHKDSDEIRYTKVLTSNGIERYPYYYDIQYETGRNYCEVYPAERPIELEDYEKAVQMFPGYKIISTSESYGEQYILKRDKEFWKEYESMLSGIEEEQDSPPDYDNLKTPSAPF